MKLADVKPTTWIKDKEKYPDGMGVYVGEFRVYLPMCDFARDNDGNFFVSMALPSNPKTCEVVPSLDRQSTAMGVLMIPDAELGYYENGNFINIESDFL